MIFKFNKSVYEGSLMWGLFVFLQGLLDMLKTTTTVSDSVTFVKVKIWPKSKESKEMHKFNIREWLERERDLASPKLFTLQRSKSHNQDNSICPPDLLSPSLVPFLMTPTFLKTSVFIN